MKMTLQGGGSRGLQASENRLSIGKVLAMGFPADHQTPIRASGIKLPFRKPVFFAWPLGA
jgi:hypothetical protein